MKISDLKNRILLPLAIGASAFSLYGCDRSQDVVQNIGEELSEVFQEDAVAVKKISTPLHYKTGLEPRVTSPADGGRGVEIHFPVGRPYMNQGVEHALVFKCEHGEFVVQGEGERFAEVYEEFQEGHEYTVEYKVAYKNFRADADGDGEKDDIRAVMKYIFVDAKPKEKEK